MSIEFNHINDYKIIIPETQQGYGIDFKILVQTHFDIPSNRDLILCLIEMVTLRNITAIGEKFLYSTLDDGDESEAFLKTYEDIITKVIKKFESKLSKYGIVGYKKWYDYNSFILTKKNQVTYPETASPDWTQSHNHSRNEGKSSDYGNIIDSNLRVEDIKEFLEYYSKLLEEELGFSNYPTYCIIVKPISVTKGKTIVPLGNLFLHFATKKEYPQDFYLELINKFLIVWFKNKGVDIISEVYNKAKKEIVKKSQKNYIPNFSHLKNPNRLTEKIKVKKIISDYTLEDYYDKYFKSNYKSFIEKCQSIANFLIPKFLQNSTIEENEYLKTLEKDSSFFKLSGVDLLVPDFNLETFEDVLFKREIFKMGFIVCNKTPQEMLYFIKTGEIKPNQPFPLKYDIWTQLFIPWASDRYDKKDFDKYSKCIVNSLSEIEKELQTYYKSVKQSASLS